MSPLRALDIAPHKPQPWLQWACKKATPEMLLRAFHGNVASAVDVRGLLAALGVQVLEDPSCAYAGAVESSAAGGARVTLRSTDPEFRKRFTLAHELGHLMLHGPGEYFRDHTFGGDEREAQANAFAAELLLPRYLLRPLVGTLSTEALASLFEVSLTAMRIQVEHIVAEAAQRG